MSVTVSRPGKVFYPDDGITKGDVFAYYEAVAETMLPHLAGRPLTLRRYPDGIEGESFFQKDASDYFPDWIGTVEVERKHDEGSVAYVLCQDADTLRYLANQACIEFHVWTSTVDDLERPDRMVIDLDPSAAEEVALLRSVARRTRDLLAELGLTAFVQATGGRGYHLVVPLDGKDGQDTVRGLAHGVAGAMAAADPEHLTTEQYKDKRGERVFLDTNRNGYGQTWICPYSLRARSGAAAATPLEWSELGKAEPDGYPLSRLTRRLAQKADPWAAMGQVAGSAAAAERRLREL